MSVFFHHLKLHCLKKQVFLLYFFSISYEPVVIIITVFCLYYIVHGCCVIARLVVFFTFGPKTTLVYHLLLPDMSQFIMNCILPCVKRMMQSPLTVAYLVFKIIARSKLLAFDPGRQRWSTQHLRMLLFLAGQPSTFGTSETPTLLCV